MFLKQCKGLSCRADAQQLVSFQAMSENVIIGARRIHKVATAVPLLSFMEALFKWLPKGLVAVRDIGVGAEIL